MTRLRRVLLNLRQATTGLEAWFIVGPAQQKCRLQKAAPLIPTGRVSLIHLTQLLLLPIQMGALPRQHKHLPLVEGLKHVQEPLIIRGGAMFTPTELHLLPQLYPPAQNLQVLAAGPQVLVVTLLIPREPTALPKLILQTRCTGVLVLAKATLLIPELRALLPSLILQATTGTSEVGT